MDFQLPQFIEVEDKVFGPLSFRQFLYVTGGIGFGYLIFKIEIVPLVIRIVPALAALVFGLALAFYKVNHRPFIYTVEASIKYLFSHRLYIWKKDNPVASTIVAGTKAQTTTLPKVSESKLKDLTWSLDIKEKLQ